MDKLTVTTCPHPNVASEDQGCFHPYVSDADAAARREEIEEIWRKFEESNTSGLELSIPSGNPASSILSVNWHYAPTTSRTSHTANSRNICMRKFADWLGLPKTAVGLTSDVLMYELFFGKVNRRFPIDKEPYNDQPDEVLYAHKNVASKIGNLCTAPIRLSMGKANVERYVATASRSTKTTLLSLSNMKLFRMRVHMAIE